MKKHLRWFIPLAFFLAIPGLLIWYVISMPSLISLARIYPQARTLPELRQISLDEAKPQGGIQLSAYGCSMTPTGYETAEDKSLDYDVSTVYILDKSKSMIIMNPDNEDMKLKMSKMLYENKIYSLSIEAYTGGRLATEYECFHAYYGASVRDISLFNNRKNEGLYWILYFRAGVANPGYKSISEFSMDDVKGFITLSGTDKPVIEATVFRQTDRNRAYRIVFMNVTLQEALPILSTLTFED